VSKNILRLVMVATFAAAAPVASQTGAEPSAAGMPKAGAYALDKRHGRIVWGTSHFGFSTYYGAFADFDAQLTLDPQAVERSRLTATINTASVATLDPELDGHLKAADFLNVAKHPTATFRSTRVARTGARTAVVTGDFTLLEVTRPITLNVTFNAAGQHPVTKAYTAGFTAEGTIRRTEFGMGTYAPAIGDEVRLMISGEFNPT
jgi:polyisoprenoid-binding protein YceI